MLLKCGMISIIFILSQCSILDWKKHNGTFDYDLQIKKLGSLSEIRNKIVVSLDGKVSESKQFKEKPSEKEISFDGATIIDIDRKVGGAIVLDSISSNETIIKFARIEYGETNDYSKKRKEIRKALNNFFEGI